MNWGASCHWKRVVMVAGSETEQPEMKVQTIRMLFLAPGFVSWGPARKVSWINLRKVLWKDNLKQAFKNKSCASDMTQWVRRVQAWQLECSILGAHVVERDLTPEVALWAPHELTWVEAFACVHHTHRLAWKECEKPRASSPSGSSLLCRPPCGRAHLWSPLLI